MEVTNYKPKRFLFPILALVLISIISIALINTYITVSVLKTNMNQQINNTKKEYSEQHNNRVYKEVNLVNEFIEFQITKIENKLRESLKEKIQIALDITNYTYNLYKDELNKEDLKKKISNALAAIKFNDDQSYYFMYDNKTKIIFGHPLKNFVGRDMTSFRDIKGQSLMQLDADSLAKNKIGYSKIYFNKPKNQTKEFPKLTCITKFEPLDLVIGIGEYLDVVENQIKKEVLERFSKFENKDKYLFILDVHDIEGGDEFATVLLNSNRSELVGNKVSDKDKDVKGNMFRKQFLEIIKGEGEGFTQYWYKKPSTETPALKVSYIYFQKAWNWIIGSGFYSNDLEEKILLMEKSISSHINDTIYKTIIWVVLLSSLAIVIAIFVSFRIDRTIEKYTNTIIDYEHNKRKQEHMLIQQSKMAAMGEMLGNIAHQWRQPLSTISTASTGAKLQKEMDCLSDTDFNYAMDSINNSAQYLSTTIDDFRNFFNPTNNKETEFLFSDTINKTLAIVSPQFVTKDIIIVKKIEELSIKSIENELIQVLLNILNNSKDALIKLEDEKRLVFINAYIENKVITIEIKDNAKGINEDIIDRIFEPYFTTKHQSQGTGIGLYMSQEIINNHLGGTLTVSNETYSYDEIEYTGANFLIKIPIVPKIKISSIKN